MYQYNEDDFIFQFIFLPIFQTATTLKHLNQEKLSINCFSLFEKTLITDQSINNKKSSSVYWYFCRPPYIIITVIYLILDVHHWCWGTWGMSVFLDWVGSRKLWYWDITVSCYFQLNIFNQFLVNQLIKRIGVVFIANFFTVHWTVLKINLSLTSNSHIRVRPFYRNNPWEKQDK